MPPRFTRDAVFEAIDAGVKLVVVVTERIPRGEVAQMVEFAKLRGARIIGPNCLGVLSPDEAKIGGLGGPAVNVRRAFKKGPIGVMSRSGGMTTEIANTLTAAGLGQSTCVSIGGDAIIGSTYAELMPLFEADPETKAIAIYSEPGGRMEAELADWVREQRSRLPIVAFMAGRFMDEMPGMRFGHAGTIVEGKADTTADKIERMRAAGISVAERIEEIPGARQGAPRTGGALGHGPACSSTSTVDARGRRRTPRSRRSWSRSARSTSSRQDAGRAVSRSSRRTSTSARSAISACRPRPPGTVQVVKLYESPAPAARAFVRSTSVPCALGGYRLRQEHDA